MTCYHRFAEIHTYRGKVNPENIIDTNYQCVECGQVFTEEQAQDYLSDDCYWCNGSKEFQLDGYEPPIRCPHCLLENNLVKTKVDQQ